jgi:two-component system response regulator YesN
MIRVLLADDEETIRRGVATVVDWHRLGCSLVATAADGREALSLFERHRPDIVITDIRMPRMNGLQLIERVRSGGSACRFVVLSGYDEFEFARTAMKLGVRHYVLKPTDEDELSDVIRDITDELGRGARPTLTHGGGTGHADVDTIIDHTVAHYDNPALSLKWISHNIVFKNSDYLGRRFKEATGESYARFLNRLRVDEACRLMEARSDARISEIAARTGFPQDGQYFSVQFKRITGVSPSAYRNRLVAS